MPIYIEYNTLSLAARSVKRTNLCQTVRESDLDEVEECCQ